MKIIYSLYICNDFFIMTNEIKKDGKFSFIEKGEGRPIIVLHGLMGGLSNFDGVLNYFSERNYKVVLPELPIYSLNILKTNVKSFARYLKKFIEARGYEDYILLGNSLGGHIALYYNKLYPGEAKGLLITGSSGLYENAMGDSFPRRGDYEFIKKKAQDVFYDPEIASKEIVDEVFATVNDRVKVIKTLTIAKSAIRHNMAKDLPKMHLPVGIIWGRNDKVTPPEVADEFNRLLPQSDLYWIEKCGHAAMMEHPDEFNEKVELWLKKNNL
jgi:pimeloyl-ACP methyl ester carboxylesterase